jgi:hypothetical protein
MKFGCANAENCEEKYIMNVESGYPIEPRSANSLISSGQKGSIWMQVFERK